MAVFIVRARLGATTTFSYNSTPYFTDVPTSYLFFQWIQKLKEIGITAGTSPTTYSPDLPVTRGEMAVFVVRAGFNDLLNPNAPIVMSLSPNNGTTGQSVSVAVGGVNTHFAADTTVFAENGVTAGTPMIIDATHLTVTLTIPPGTTPGQISITAQTPSASEEEATIPNGFTVNGAISITDFNPKSAPAGTLVIVSGTNLFPDIGSAAQFTLARQGGGALTGFASSTTPTSLTFIIPAGAATGVPSITVNGLIANAAAPLVIVPPSTFTLNAAPGALSVIQGQSIGVAVSMASTTGFNSLAALSVTGVPSGVTAAFNPSGITAGQTSVLTLTAPGSQPIATSALSINAAASVSGIPMTQTSGVSLSVVAPTTSFLGRTVVSDAQETPLAGVIVTMLGVDGSGNATDCAGSTTSDSAGNFALTNLTAGCVGPQLVGFGGNSVTSPAGKYAGVNLVFTLVSGHAVVSPILVHLPLIDNVETFMVQQNATTDQSHVFTTIPGLSLTVYAGTTFTESDGTQPNPFPLAAVEVAVDRLPDIMPPTTASVSPFIVAFQPANTVASEEVAVSYPNTLNTPPGTDMPLMTLNPTLGRMVPYGTARVSTDGTQILPDIDPSTGSLQHRFGIVHFDWHGPAAPPPPQNNPGPPGGGPGSGDPGGGSGPGGTPGSPCSAGDGDGGGGGGDNGGCLGPAPILTSNPPDPDCNSCPCTAEKRVPEFFKEKDHSELATLQQAERPADQPETGNTLLALAADQKNPFVDGNRAEAGDPVDMTSGIQTLTHRDFLIQGSRGFALIRNYRSMTTQAGPFGIGGNHNFNYGTDTAFPTLAGSINLIMPDGNRYPFTFHACPHFITVGGQPYPCASGMTNSNIPALAGAVLTANSDSSADLRWKSGIVYHFIPISFQTGSMLGSITDANGNVTTIARDGSGNVTIITDPVGRTLIFVYDGSSRVISLTDPIGRTTHYTYNAQGSLATFTNPAGGVTQFTYDASGNLLTMTDPQGILQIQNTLDANGRVIKQVRSDGGTLTFSYTLMNPIAVVTPLTASQVTDSNGVVAIYRMNTDGYVTDVASTQGQTKHITLESGSNLKSGAIMASASTTYTYDPNGNVLTSTDPTGLTTTFTYDPNFSKVTSITDPLGNITSFTYDAHGNLLTSRDANGNATSFQYDSTGLLTKVTDALNQTTTYSYDGLGDLISVTDPLGNTSRSVYDGLSRLTQTIDALGRRTYFAYDNLGRLLTRTDAKAGVTTSTWDADSNLLSIKDANGNTNTFTYDPMNRLLSRTDGLGKSDARTWDTNGNLTKYVDRRGQTSAYAYDTLNRLTTETYSDATVTRAYDWYGRLSQVSDSASGKFTFNYDLAGRLLGTSNPVGAVNYTYDGRGAMAARQVVGQPALVYAYDPAGNLTSAAIPQASATFSYSARNQLTGITRGNGVLSAYNYDQDGRLLSITHSKGAAILASDSYGYDAVGNRLSHAASIAQPLVTPATTNTFNAANQMTQFGSTANVFDPNGNLAKEGVATTYTWDGRNRLKSIATAAGQTTNFAYDFAGNLITQADSGPSLNLTKSFVLDDLTDIANETASDGTSYSVLAGRSIDSHLAVSQLNGQILFGLADGINSTVATVDQNGTQQSQFLYEPYGQTTTAGKYPFQFAGRTPVNENLYYNRARFYDSQSGRLLSEDPTGMRGGPNLYQYGANNPLKYLDPTGLDVTVTVDRNPTNGTSVTGTIGVTSTVSTSTFSGFTLENQHAGEEGDKSPIPADTYDAFARTDYSPNRIQLENVPGYEGIQFHVGNSTNDVSGCFAVGTSSGTNFVGNSGAAMNTINNIISADGSGNITVIVH
jgi:RHS repeat-associated protein